MKQKKVTIVGAGLTGLVAGYRLGKMGYKIIIYEKSSSTGGLMGGFKIEETSIEKVYHHIFKTDNYIIDLIKELGLEDKLHWHSEKTAIYCNNKLYSFMGAVDLLKFKPLELITKIRLGLVKIWLEKDNAWEKYKPITAVNWMKKYCGENGYKVIWEPLLKGKFHSYFDKISMAWLWARIHTRANSDGYLGYLDGGFQQIADKLVEEIKKNGGEILLDKSWKLEAGNENETVIYTGPSKEVDYLGAINLVFTSKQSLSPYYWHNINDTDSPFLAFIQHTNLVDKSQYGNKHVYYLGAYLPHNHKYFSSDEVLIKKDFFKYLKKIFPKFEEKRVEESWVYRFKNAQHLVTTDYKVPAAKIGKNILVTNFAQIFPEDRGTNFAVREGNRVAASFPSDPR